MAKAPNYGTGYWIMAQNGSVVASGSGLNYELDLSDRETATASNTALDGTRHTTRKGQYINPRITIFYPASDLQTTYNGIIGEVVEFYPHNENLEFHFPCTVIDCYPEFDDDCPSLVNLTIELESTGYVTFVAYDPTYTEEQQE